MVSLSGELGAWPSLAGGVALLGHDPCSPAAGNSLELHRGLLRGLAEAEGQLEEEVGGARGGPGSRARRSWKESMGPRSSLRPEKQRFSRPWCLQ